MIKELKLKKRHPMKKFRLGRHMILPAFAEYDLNDAELKELSGEGAVAWIMEVEEKKVKKIKKD